MMIFYYENGLEAFVEYLNEEKDVLHPVVSFEGKRMVLKLSLLFNLMMAIQKMSFLC